MRLQAVQHTHQWHLSKNRNQLLCVADTGHVRSSRPLELEGAPAQIIPTSPLSGYAELLQRDLSASFGSPGAPPQPAQPEPAPSSPALAEQGPATQAPCASHASVAAASQHSTPAPAAQSAAVPLQGGSRSAASISSAQGASFANPLLSMPARYTSLPPYLTPCKAHACTPSACG